MDSTSSGYQVILLQDNDPYKLTVINVRPGEKQTVPVVASGRYCIMELPMGDKKSDTPESSLQKKKQQHHPQKKTYMISLNLKSLTGTSLSVRFVAIE